MSRVYVHYHEKAGLHNTQETLQAAQERAGELGIRQLVVPTTTGQTALTCAEMMPEMDIIVGVTMHAVDREVYVNRPGGRVRAPHPEIMARAREKGVKFYTGVHSLMGGVAAAIKKEFGGLPDVELIARTYFTISTGTKVAMESMLMAADAGYLRMDEDVICLGGWRGGADTALVVKPSYTHTFFSCRVREFIALPRGGDAD